MRTVRPSYDSELQKAKCLKAQNRISIQNLRAELLASLQRSLTVDCLGHGLYVLDKAYDLELAN